MKLIHHHFLSSEYPISCILNILGKAVPYTSSCSSEICQFIMESIENRLRFLPFIEYSQLSEEQKNCLFKSLATVEEKLSKFNSMNKQDIRINDQQISDLENKNKSLEQENKMPKKQISQYEKNESISDLPKAKEQSCARNDNESNVNSDYSYNSENQSTKPAISNNRHKKLFNTSKNINEKTNETKSDKHPKRINSLEHPKNKPEEYNNTQLTNSLEHENNDLKSQSLKRKSASHLSNTKEKSGTVKNNKETSDYLDNFANQSKVLSDEDSESFDDDDDTKNKIHNHKSRSQKSLPNDKSQNKEKKYDEQRKSSYSSNEDYYYGDGDDDDDSNGNISDLLPNSQTGLNENDEGSQSIKSRKRGKIHSKEVTEVHHKKQVEQPKKPLHISRKNVERINIFKENEKIVKKGSYINLIGYSCDIQKDLEYSIDNTKTITSHEHLKYKKYDLSSVKLYSLYLKVEVTRESTFTAAIRAKNLLKKVCVLNFASATQPGGGVLNGRNAQEEVLSRQSTLYFSLKGQKPFYDYNKSHPDPFGTDYMIYSPNVLIIRDEKNFLIKPVKVSVISSVAVNNSELKKLYPNEDKSREVKRAMEKRCRRILEVCISEGNDVIVLGAFGCGVFNNSAKVVSGIFKKLLYEEKFACYFHKIIFAIKTKPTESQELFYIFENALTSYKYSNTHASMHPSSTSTYPSSTSMYPSSTSTYPSSTSMHPSSTSTYPSSTSTYPSSTSTNASTTSQYYY